MKLSAFHFWKPCKGVTFLKIAYQRNPNSDWHRGFGITVLNVGAALYWNRCSIQTRPALQNDLIRLTGTVDLGGLHWPRLNIQDNYKAGLE